MTLFPPDLGQWFLQWWSQWFYLLFQAGELSLMAAGILTVYANILTRLDAAQAKLAAAVVAEALRASTAAATETIRAETTAAALLAADQIRAVAVIEAARVIAEAARHDSDAGPC